MVLGENDQIITERLQAAFLSEQVDIQQLSEALGRDN